MKKCVVYGLYSSRDGELRYIGQTVHSLVDRWNQHVWNSANPKLPVQYWIRRERKDGFIVEMRVLCGDAIFNVTETELIAYHRASGSKLLNLTDGGGGQLGFVQSPDHVRKRALAKTGVPLTDEHRAKISLGHRGKSLSPEHRRRIGSAHRGMKRSAETRARISAALMGIVRVVSEETKKKIGAAHRGVKRSEETKKRMSASAVARWAVTRK